METDVSYLTLLVRTKCIKCISRCWHGARDLWGSTVPLLVRQGVAIDAKSKHEEGRMILPRLWPPGGVKPYSGLCVYWWCLSTTYMERSSPASAGNRAATRIPM